jgi:Cys-rich repeat protein
VIQSSNYGSPVCPISDLPAALTLCNLQFPPTFLKIESSAAVAPTLINDEVEGSVDVSTSHPHQTCTVNSDCPSGDTCRITLGTGVDAVTNHGCNPFGSASPPVWLSNAWNNHPILVDGNENITSISNLLNNAVVTNSPACVVQGQPQLPYILSLNETGWNVEGSATSADLVSINRSGAQFGVKVAAAAGMTIQGGLSPDGSGLKHQTVTTGSVPPAGKVSQTFK